SGETKGSDETEDTLDLPPLQWVKDSLPLSFVPNWTVKTSSEEFLEELTDAKYGNRVTGSVGNRAAAEWIEDQFIKLNLQQFPDLPAYLQPYLDTVFEVLPGSAWIVAADGTEKELELGKDWVFSASFTEIDQTLPLSADLKECEKGNAFLNANEVEQKHFRKAIEIVTADTVLNLPYQNTGNEASRIMVTEKVYKQLMREGVKLHLKLPADAKAGQAENVIGYLPGADSSRAVVLGAHFDASGQAGTVMRGAYDNASGVAALLQTAKWLSKGNPPCDVIFAAFNGEGCDFAGSNEFAFFLDGKYEQVLMINLECVGWKDEALTVYGNSEQEGLRDNLAGVLGIQYRDYSPDSDAASFQLENMRAVTISQDRCLTEDTIRGAWNIAQDTAENLDSAMIDQLARNLCAWVMERGRNRMITYPVFW
ncbi:MAG: M28 family peptidase, partial [Lachnospiraceae bacterium]|nr:M28 family peptidase [Lachnospiraceae bacterium]